ncbi:hypothetical protein PYCC9005_004943 [Savitreella phatthalungensis]
MASSSSASRTIYIHRHIITSQTLYSTSANIRHGTSKIHAQLPDGRRTRPQALRKDHWEPLCWAHFGDTGTMTKVLGRMSDFRRWRAAIPASQRKPARIPEQSDHVAPDDNKVYPNKRIPDGAAQKPPKKYQRRQAAFDMTAESIADLSAACAWAVPVEEAQKVEVEWLDIQRKRHAVSWPENVTHSQTIKLAKGFRLDKTQEPNETLSPDDLSAAQAQQEATASPTLPA